MTDYRTMSGAEFKREVGCDPEKWAEAMLQRLYGDTGATVHDWQLAWLTGWLRDAMQAARDDEKHNRIV